MSSGDSFLEVEGLTVSFGHGADRFDAVRDVSLSLTRGRTLAIVGSSGSGKSVTARAIVGLADGLGGKAQTTARTLRLGDLDLNGISERSWRGIRGRRIGFILQDALVSLDPLKRIGSEVEEVLRAHRIGNPEERRRRVLETMTAVGIPEAQVRARQYPHELSGGLRQRALIASTVAARPELVIADEPTTALDVTVQAQVLQTLSELKDAGTSLLLISHDLAVVAQLADDILVMSEGRIVESGPVARVLQAPEHPMTRELIAAASPARIDRPTHDAGAITLAGRELRKEYLKPDGSTLVAVARASVPLRSGTVLGVVGESGSGKSTLASMMLGLTAPTSGEVTLDGAPFSAVPERHRRSLRADVQVIPQDPFGSFDPRARVRSIVAEPLHLHSDLPGRIVAQRVGEQLAEVGLDTTILDRRPHQLSGGQRQRVAIARALITRPRVLICDEPLSALDVTIQTRILDLLAELGRERDLAMLFISHDLGVVRRIADEVLVMKDGEIVESGDVEQIYDQPQHGYTRALLAAVPTLTTG